MTVTTAETSARPPVALAPALSLLDRLRAGSRLAVLSVVLLIPGLVTTWSYAWEIQSQIRFASSERAGLDTAAAAVTAMAATISATGPGDIDLTPLTDALAENPDLDPDDRLTQVEATLDATGTPEGRLATVQALAGLVADVGDHSDLVLDPELDSFHLAQAVVTVLPDALVATAGLAAAGDDATARAATGMAVTAAAQRLAASLDDVTDPALADQLEPVRRAAQAAQSAAGSPDADPAGIATSLAGAVDPMAGVLDTLLDQRISALQTTRTRSLAITSAGLAIAIYLAVAVVWRTRHDVESIVGGVEALAMGDHASRPVPSGSDEFGRIGRALVMTRSVLAEAQAELVRQEADREAQTRVAFNRQRDAEEQVRVRAQSIISETAEIVIQELQDVVQQVAEMRSAADVIESRVSQAERVTSTVVGQARTTDEVVHTLRESLRRVGGMAKLIAGVADQSKLLALNATIEAARAGDAGRGFGVVAGEVKGLASATGASTNQITSTVADLERDTHAVSTAISRMSEGIRGVDETTSSLRVVASQQRDVVEALDAAVDTTIERIRQMSRLHERLERRVHQRIPVSRSATLRAGDDELPIKLVDMSEGGMRFTTERRSPGLFLGATVDVDIDVDGSVVTATGSVVHHDPLGDGVSIGLRFHDLPSKAYARVESHLRRLIESQPAPV